MNRYERYLHLSAALIHEYRGAEPFAHYLKKYFISNKQLGSRDRKQMAACCYAYFRTGHLLESFPITEAISIALFLCTSQHDSMLEHLSPALFTQAHLPLDEKCKLAAVTWDDAAVFPWIDELSEGIESHTFVRSLLSQPHLYIRIRPGKKETVERKLQHAAIPYECRTADCIALENGTDLTKILDLDREAVVQDWGSQRIAELFTETAYKQDDEISVWDACAASGGKSILCKDFFTNATLTVSDIRASSLHNLKERCTAAGVKYEESFVADLRQDLPLALKNKKFDLIIADVPCTGSGTWSRTPEWLHFFKQEQILEFAALQQKIIGQIIPQLATGGYLLYSTCSVFAEENERQVLRMMHQYNLEPVSRKIFSGYKRHADTLFGALLRKA